MANIAIAKFSKSIRFDASKWGAIGGDNEAPYFAYTMAKAFPQHTFWIVGRSDYSRVFPDGLLPNLKDAWHPKYWPNRENPVKLINTYSYDENPEVYWNYYKYLLDLFNRIGVNIDFGFMLWGIWFSCSLYEYTKKIRNPDEYAKTIVNATHYMSFLVYWLNNWNGEYVGLVTDPRHFTGCARDLSHWQQLCLSQVTGNFDSHCTRFKFDMSKAGSNGSGQVQHPNIYSGLETMNLLSKKPYREFPEKTGFTLILNQGRPAKTKKEKPPRYLELKKWLLDSDMDFSIYGKWDNDILTSDTRFKGSIPPSKLGEVLETAKYTLCIPIDPGWATAKFLEMVHYGLIPFVTYDYGTMALETGVPEYVPEVLRVKSRQELIDRIQYFEDNPDIYQKMINYLQSQMTKMYTGEYLINLVKKNLLMYTETKFDLGDPVITEKPIAELFENDAKLASNQTIEIDDLF